MRQHPIRNLAILEDEGAPRRARVRAASELAVWARLKLPEVEDLREIYERISSFWQSLCNSDEEASHRLLIDRSRLASACTTLSSALPEGRRLFRNIPAVKNAEGPHPHKEGSLLRGRFDYSYGSIYEFHLEYPIEGFGVRKDLISVVEADGRKTPLFEWLRSQELVVWCSRCGLEITYEISRDCPARRLRRRTDRPRLSVEGDSE